NAHLDALAERRHADGRRALSVAWGVCDLVNDHDDPAVTERPRAANPRAGAPRLPPTDPASGRADPGRLPAPFHPVRHHAPVLAELDRSRFPAPLTSVPPSTLLSALHPPSPAASP
ncbi:hypothetical protein VM98_35705, partial [Streptomyces rubellomurinus subsp. indigoferus]